MNSRAWILWVGLASATSAQPEYGYRLGERVGDHVVYSTRGVPLYTAALEPTVQRWYLPASLFSEKPPPMGIHQLRPGALSALRQS